MKKTALITGSSKGIGRATAIEFARNGYDVGITYCSSKSGAEEVLKIVQKMGAEAELIKVDVSSVDDIEKMLEQFIKRFGRIDALVNNAGMDSYNPFLQTDVKQYDQVMDTNLKSAFFASQIAAKDMIENGVNGSIINMSSVHAQSCWPNYSAYAMTKAAMTRMTQNCAMELAEHGIRVNVIHPGYIDVGWDENDIFFSASKKIPLKRFGTPDEIAHMAFFLASDKASYITGSVFNVDGGLLLPNAAENNY